MSRSPLLVVVCLALSGCGGIPFFGGRDLAPAEPLPFETRIIVEEGQPEFRVQVAASAGLEAVRESVRFEATRYCLTRFGTSDVTWNASAGDPEAWIAQTGDAGGPIYSGRCLGR